MFDIRKIAIGETANMPVCDVDGNVVCDEQGNELSITFYGPGTKQFVKARAELSAELMREYAQEQENLKKKNKPKVNDIDLEAANRRTVDFLSKLTVSLNGFEYPGGAKAMFSDASLGHIVQAADEFINDRGNFKTSFASGSSNSYDTQPG